MFYLRVGGRRRRSSVVRSHGTAFETVEAYMGSLCALGPYSELSVCILPLALPPAAPLRGVPIAKGGAESSVSPDRADSEQTQTL